MDGSPVGEETEAALFGRPDASEQHQSRWDGEAGSVGMRVQGAATQAPESGLMRVATGVVDDGQAVRLAVTVCDEAQVSGGEIQHGVT